jgi:potassium-transporting ATPase KdpC subunit
MNSIISIMKKATWLLIIFTVLCGVLYTAVITMTAQVFFPKQADGSIIEADGRKYGSELLGQKFTNERHMWGRIMNIDVTTYKSKDNKTLMYATPSNLSPASDEYEDLVEQRVAMLREANPNMDEASIPVDLVTGSGSGLDPHISPAAADYQVSRIANAHHMTEEEVRGIIGRCTNDKFLGVFGEETVNVLKVNLILDGLVE